MVSFQDCDCDHEFEAIIVVGSGAVRIAIYEDGVGVMVDSYLKLQ